MSTPPRSILTEHTVSDNQNVFLGSGWLLHAPDAAGSAQRSSGQGGGGEAPHSGSRAGVCVEKYGCDMCVAIKPTKRSIICNISHKSKLSDAPTRLQRPAHAGSNNYATQTQTERQRPERAWRGCRLTESSQLRRAHEYSVSAPLTPIRSTTSSTSPYDHAQP